MKLQDKPLVEALKRASWVFAIISFAIGFVSERVNDSWYRRYEEAFLVGFIAGVVGFLFARILVWVVKRFGSER